MPPVWKSLLLAAWVFGATPLSTVADPPYVPEGLAPASHTPGRWSVGDSGETPRRFAPVSARPLRPEPIVPLAFERASTDHGNPRADEKRGGEADSQV